MPSGARTSKVGPYTLAVARVLTDALGERSKSEVGRAAGIEQSMISRMLNGRKSINVEELTAICRALGLSPRSVIVDAERIVKQRGDLPPIPAQRGD